MEKTGKYLGIDIAWKGSGLNETGYNIKSGKTIVKINKQFYRPAEVNFLNGDSSKAKKILNWKPKHNIDSLIKDMCDASLNKL